MKIAGHTASVTSLFESTPQYFRAYLTEGPGEFSFTVTREHIAFEQAELLEEALREGFKPRVFTDPFLERQAIQRAFARFLFPFRILPVHGSALAVDGEGFLFTAHSGTGKSTHARLWKQVLGDRALIVNDDKPFLQLDEQGVLLHGSPWSGKHGLDCNVCFPLKGICLLERGTQNRIRRISPEEALPMLLQETCLNMQPDSEEAFLRLAGQLSRSVPLWKMACTKDPQAAVMAWEAMKTHI